MRKPPEHLTWLQKLAWFEAQHQQGETAEGKERRRLLAEYRLDGAYVVDRLIASAMEEING